MADNMPDFDKMSPEEIMAWMETLAKRQGASEGFTTAADSLIAEIDENTAVIDGPGYIPYDTKIGDLKPGAVPKTPLAPPSARTAPPPPPAVQQQPPPARTAPPPPPAVQQPPPPARTAPPPPPAVQQQPPPARTAPPPQQPPARSVPPSPPAVQQPPPPARTAPPPPPARTAPPPSMQQQPPPARTAPPPPPARNVPPPSMQQPPPPAARGGSSMDEGALAWLENLASEQEDSLFNLDLSDVPGDSGADNSMAWLENLAASAPAESAPVPSRGGSSDNDDPFASGGNPIAWLEQLAREQGAKSEEMTTPASPHDDYSRDIAAPDFSNLGAELELLPPQDPSDFLQSLASSQGYDEIGVSAVRPPAMPEPITYDLDIDQAIASGTASRDQMQQWLELQTDKLMESEEIDLLPEDTFDLLAEEDADAPAIPAELPSWLVESFGMPPTAPAAAQPNRPSLESLFPADDPAELSEMPEWLKAESGASAVMDLDSIFADDEPTMPYVEIDIVPLSSPSIQVPTNQAKPGGDRWAEAFDDEYSQGAVDINNVPDWYQRNLNDAERVAAVERMVTSESLPDEDRLAAGQPQSVPDWLAESVVAPPAPPFEAAPVAEEPTDWMKDLETTISPDDIPAWLLETIDEQPSVDDTIDLFDIDLEPEPPAPEPVRQTPPPVRAAPPPRAPEPVRAPVSRAGLSLGEARRLSQSGALADGLAHYEGMIRAQVELDDVVDDLSSLSRQHRDNPTIFRVLGDGLMRQGKLQAALDTYRQALNQL